MSNHAEPGVVEYLESNWYLSTNDPSDGTWLSGIINSYKSWQRYMIRELHPDYTELEIDRVIQRLNSEERWYAYHKRDSDPT